MGWTLRRRAWIEIVLLMVLLHICSPGLIAVARWLSLYKPYTLPVCDLEVPAVTKGLVEITVPSVHQTQPAQGQIWLVKTRNPDIYGYFPRGRMGAHSNAPAVLVHNTYLYLQSAEHLYLYTFRLCIAPYLLTPGCVSHLCGKICLLCILAIIIFISFPFSPCGGTLQGSWWQRKTQGRLGQQTFQRHALALLYLFDLLSYICFSLNYCTCPFWFISERSFWKHVKRYL